MHSVICVSLAILVLANASTLAGKPMIAAQAVDRLCDTMVDELVDRAREVSTIHHADLDNTSVEKPSQLAPLGSNAAALAGLHIFRPTPRKVLERRYQSVAGGHTKTLEFFPQRERRTVATPESVVGGGRWCLGDTPHANLEANEASSISSLIFTLDTHFRDLQFQAKYLLPHYFKPAAENQMAKRFQEAEILNSNGGYDKLCTEFSESGYFENRRSVVEGRGPISHAWHGWVSRQRILLQDESFIAATQDESQTLMNVALILGGCGSLAPMLLGGLSYEHSLAYMMTASPNWENIPKGYEVKMACSRVVKQNNLETPVDITRAALELKLNSIHNIACAFETLRQECEIPHAEPDCEKERRVQELHGMSLALIYSKAKESLRNSERAAALAAGSAGASTGLLDMMCQSLSVMKHFKSASNLSGNDAAALSLGIFSHALDARHLVAAIHASTGLTSNPHYFDEGQPFEKYVGAYPAQRDGVEMNHIVGSIACVEAKEGLTALEALLEASDESLEGTLLLYRLKEVMMLEIMAS